MYARQITNEETYALSEAKRIINAEQSRKREKLISKAKQKTLGILAIGVSAIEIALAYANMIDEGGASIIMIPLGLYLLITRKTII